MFLRSLAEHFDPHSEHPGLSAPKDLQANLRTELVQSNEAVQSHQWRHIVPGHGSHLGADEETCGFGGASGTKLYQGVDVAAPRLIVAQMKLSISDHRAPYPHVADKHLGVGKNERKRCGTRQATALDYLACSLKLAEL